MTYNFCCLLKKLVIPMNFGLEDSFCVLSTGKQRKKCRNVCENRLLGPLKATVTHLDITRDSAGVGRESERR